MLHNKLPQTLAVYNSKRVWSYTISLYQEFGSSLVGTFWLKVSKETVAKLSAMAAVI